MSQQYVTRLARHGRLAMRRRAFKIESKRAARRGSGGGLAAAIAMARTAPERGLTVRGLQYNLHRFMRWRDTRAEGGVGPLSISCNFGATGVNGAAFNFSLTQVSHYVELTALYDAYRIDKVELWFDYTPDVNNVLGRIENYPKMWIKRDYDDITVPTLDQMEQSNQSECLRFTADRTTIGPYYITPAVSMAMYDSTAPGSVTFGAQRWRKWIDTSIVGRAVPHYGVKMVAQGIPSANLGAITVRVRFHLSMKNVR